MGSEVKIGEVVTLSQGFAVNSKSKHLMADSGLPLLRITDLINNTQSQYLTKATAPEKCVASPEDIIYTRTGQVGLVFRNRQGIVHNNCFKVIPNPEKLERGFLYWYLRQSHIKKLANNIASGSVQKDLNHSAFKSMTIKLLPKTQQLIVAKILDSLETKIEHNCQTNQTLEKMAQALFKSWFVDFDPVIDNALAAGTNISDFPEPLRKRAELRTTVLQSAGANKLSEDIRILFPCEFEESELGWMPKEWNVKTLSDLLEVKYGKDHKKLNDGEYPVYGSGGVMRYAEQYLYSGESVLIPRKGTLNNIIYIDREFWTVDTMFYTIPKINNIAKFAYQYLKTLDFSSMNVGSAVPSMTTKVLNALNIVTPTEALLEKFDDILASQFNKIDSNEKESQCLINLRDVLLPRLISGELKVDSKDCV